MLYPAREFSQKQEKNTDASKGWFFRVANKYISADPQLYSHIHTQTSLRSSTVQHAVLHFNLKGCGNINAVLLTLNNACVAGSHIILYSETSESIKKEYHSFRFKAVGKFLYAWVFLLHRVIPKSGKIMHHLYRSLTKGQWQIFSNAELMGLLYRSGFVINDYETVNDKLVISCIKRAQPDEGKVFSYWPIFRMMRVGKNGKLISVYKVRTMHPYAEYLQEFIRINHGLDTGGKFKNDFRLTSWGRFLRRYWIDELPMIVNLLKGDLKLFGVRPLSRNYFQLYSKELQELRNKTKPGLIPPFYAEYPTPKNLEDVMKSELNYLQQYNKNPLGTDIKYMAKALYNILIKRARSK